MDTRLTVDGYEIRVLDGPYMQGSEATPEAEEFARELIAMLSEMRKFATAQLLETYNDSWAEDGDDELTSIQFEANLISPKIILYDEVGAATVYFEDSGMFGGHRIDVSIDDGELSDASLVG